MGYGDFKLLAALGAWLGWQAILPIVLMASVLGAVVGLVMKAGGSLREGRFVPFGPFLAGGGLVVMLAGLPTVLGWMGWSIRRRARAGGIATIGLTGGIGSGKSTVAALLVALRRLPRRHRRHRARADAARRRRDAGAGHGLRRRRIVDRRRRARPRPDAPARLRRRRRQGAARSHPAPADRRRGAAARPRAAGARPVVFDVPLLAESSHWRARVDRVLVVDCDEATQVARVAAAPGLDRGRRAPRHRAAGAARRAPRHRRRGDLQRRPVARRSCTPNCATLWALWWPAARSRPDETACNTGPRRGACGTIGRGSTRPAAPPVTSSPPWSSTSTRSTKASARCCGSNTCSTAWASWWRATPRSTTTSRWPRCSRSWTWPRVPTSRATCSRNSSATARSCRLPRPPRISEAALDEVIGRIDHAFDGLNQLQGKAGQALAGNEWLMSIRSRINIPGGTCEFDLPAYYAWQQHAPERRRADLQGWMTTLLPLAEALQVLLGLLRESGAPQRMVAPAGHYQQSLQQGKLYQLMRVRHRRQRRRRARDQRPPAAGLDPLHAPRRRGPPARHRQPTPPSNWRCAPERPVDEKASNAACPARPASGRRSSARATPGGPFCSERCRSVDLGAWASERFRVPAEAPTDDDERAAGRLSGGRPSR